MSIKVYNPRSSTAQIITDALKMAQGNFMATPQDYGKEPQFQDSFDPFPQGLLTLFHCGITQTVNIPGVIKGCFPSETAGQIAHFPPDMEGPPGCSRPPSISFHSFITAKTEKTKTLLFYRRLFLEQVEGLNPLMPAKRAIIFFIVYPALPVSGWSWFIQPG